jgi:glycosyltransferase involved in cell wall biosynthesis
LLASAHYPPRIGGVERYAHQLALGLAGRGHDVRVLTTGPGPGPVTETEQDGLPVVRLPARWRWSATPFDPGWVRAVPRILASARPDVVITHAPVPGLADVCLAGRGGTPAIATYHSGSMRKGRPFADPVIGAYESTLLPRLLRRAEAVVTTYPGPVAGVPGRYIPPGVDPAVFHPDPGAVRDPDLVVYAGRVEHASAWKGIATLLRAVARLAATHPGIRLELAGGGDAVDHFRTMAAGLGIGGRVRFLGPQAPGELAGTFRRAALVALPSETDAEAFGMVLVEAMACATPVVASRVGGMPAVVSDTGGGVLAEPGDSRDLAAAIGALLSDSGLRAGLAAAGLARVVERYRWEAVVDGYEELIQPLTKEGGLVARNPG